ncbi:uncharacterized protein [Ptychodera flava]
MTTFRCSFISSVLIVWFVLQLASQVQTGSLRQKETAQEWKEYYDTGTTIPSVKMMSTVHDISTTKQNAAYSSESLLTTQIGTRKVEDDSSSDIMMVSKKLQTDAPVATPGQRNEEARPTCVSTSPGTGKSCLLNITESEDVGAFRVSHGSIVIFTCPQGKEVDNSTSSPASSICIDGAIDFHHNSCVDIDECKTDQNDCGLERRCHNTVGSYKCLCRDGFIYMEGLCVPIRWIELENKVQRHDKVSLDTEGKHCSDNVNNIWERTEANRHSSWIPCPSGSVGLMRRFCKINGKWDTPDTTECKSRELLKIARKVPEITGVADVVAVLDSLANVSEYHNLIYAGDMLLISEVLFNTAVEVSSFESASVNEMNKYIELFIERQARLISPDLEELWKQVYQEHGPNDGVVGIFSAFGPFSDTVYDVMYRSGQDITLSRGTVGLKAFFVKRTEEYVVDTAGISIKANRRLLQVNGSDVPESYVKLPLSTLEKINSSRYTDTPLAVITYVYQNPGDILPTDYATARSEERQWVKSITAVKKIEKVNTPVISVSVYPKHRKDIDIDVNLRFYEKEEGYSPKCSSMDAGATYG